MKPLFRQQLLEYKDQCDVLRIELKSGAPFKCKVIDVETDFFVILDEDERYLALPINAVVSIRNVTGITGFEWRGK